MSCEHLRQLGARSRPAALLRLAAGPLTMLFDPATAFLRRICLGDVEVIRGIYGAVRDRNWETVLPRIELRRVTSSVDAFDLTFAARCDRREIRFAWRGRIRGERNGTVTFEFNGEAESDFRKNRIGLCVLHPVKECAGQSCRLQRTGGAIEAAVFPQFVAPHQPFHNLQAIVHEIVPGVEAEVRLTGEVFETEDQRNWTDASFKTYGTPLDQPFPVRVRQGERFRQTVRLRLIGVNASLRVSSPRARPRHRLPGRERSQPLHGRRRERGRGRTVHLEEEALLLAGNGHGSQPVSSADPVVDAELPTTTKIGLPAVGLGIASHDHALSPGEIGRLRRLRLSHLRADLDFQAPDWRLRLARATAEARAIGSRLHLALHLSDDTGSDLKALLLELAARRPPVSLWLVYQKGSPATPESCLRRAQSLLAPSLPNIPLAGGAHAHFADLNRHRPPPDSIALPCFGMCPQVHAFDESTMMENLEGQRAALETTRQFSRHPVVLSPVTLRERFNPVATARVAGAKRTALPASVDVRQMSLFAAAWTAGSLVGLSSGGPVHSLTYFETTGWRGIMETEAGSPLPMRFPSIPGGVFPMYFVFRGMAGYRRSALLRWANRSGVSGICLFKADGRRRVMLANLTAGEHTVRLRSRAKPTRIRELDSANVEAAAREPERFWNQSGRAILLPAGGLEVALAAYALAFVDFVA